ncbi:MAG TPA: amylo-alpha-1,6-glucosidase [Gemmatimonadales bacterium]
MPRKKASDILPNGGENQYYIAATEERADDRTRVLKHGDTFAVFDRHGDIKQIGNREQGIYCDGTRLLSHLELLLNGEPPLLLSSTVRDDNALLAVDLTNPDIFEEGHVRVARGSLHLFRSIFLWEGCCYERQVLANHSLAPIDASISIHYDADFADIFEVRGSPRTARGERTYQVDEEEGELLYHGLDGVERSTRVVSDPSATALAPGELRFDISLAPQAVETIFFTWIFDVGSARARALQYDDALNAAFDSLARRRNIESAVSTSNEQFDSWLSRSSADVHMMITQTAHGPYPYAGVPWFSTPFGRDGIITALEYLWINPELARGVLRYLASTQAEAVIAAEDAEPGKILHEARRGEMAALKEIPFGRYYGGADTTPLFVILAGAYYERTGDRDTAEHLWPHVERALEWMWKYGDSDGDGFLEYNRRSKDGLVNQGWKDSHDAVFHHDGRLAEPPIAMCEIQGYACAALRAASELAQALGRAERAVELDQHAEKLRQQIDEAFWCEDIGTYALALDGKKQPCVVRASNAGHLLFCGIPGREHAARIAETLLDASSYSGWGVRTVATSEVRYNPMSYHNGSIWPHDNALIGLGLARYGIKSGAMRVLTGLFDASMVADLHRMPELFCGFARRPGEGPTAYPVACAPQSWAAAAVYLLLQSCIGLNISAPKKEVQFRYPELPRWLDRVVINNLKVGAGSLDLELYRENADVGVTIARREGEVNVVVVK